ERPSLSDTTPRPAPSPLTWTGVAWSVGAVPSPSSPDALLTQASTVPSDLRARPNAAPAAMPTTPLPDPSPLTCTGVGWSVGAVPSPSSPDAFLPQATTRA